MTATVRRCPSCREPLHGPFCSECGAAASPAASADKRVPLPYVIGGAAVLLLGLLLLIRTSSDTAAPVVSTTPPAAVSAAPPVAGAAGLESGTPGTPPDLSAMTPVEQFDRLFDRVMRASEGGDTANVVAFAPMALAAYGMLASPDADARFHAGLIRIATGDLAGAKLLADSITAERPAHLFGIVLKGRIAEKGLDGASLTTAHRDFLAAYPAEMAAQRPEYPGHQTILDRFLQDARGAKP
ncbi:MAG: hypothetical protein ABL986_10280 [Vicinamibacterales bacterium]